MLVTNSSSANTVLPREQNQPGRRLEQAAHPTGTCRAMCFSRECVAAGFSAFIMIFGRPLPFNLLT